MFESHLITVKPFAGNVTILIGGTDEELVAAFVRRRVAKYEALTLAAYCRKEMKDNLAATLYTNTRPGALFVYFPKRPDITKPKVVDTHSTVTHPEPPTIEPSLIFFSHSLDLKFDRYHFELAFSDGKVISDKLLLKSPRAIVANHFQLLADALRAMDAAEPMPDEDG